MSELKPCPFCGGAAEVERYGTGRVSCIVACTMCGVRLESNENGTGNAWNQRAADVTVSIERAQCGFACRKRSCPGCDRPKGHVGPHACACETRTVF